MENKYKEINSIVDHFGIMVTFHVFIEAWSKYGGNIIEEVSPKQVFYNTGPTAYDKKVGMKLFRYYRDKEFNAIYSIWYRNDGMGQRVFKWEGTEAEFDAYVPQNETPYAIEKEWGIEK